MIWTLQWLAGQLFDGMVGRMVNGLGAPQPRRSGRSDPGGSSPLLPATAWEPRAGTGQAPVLKDKDLEGDAIKLVSYAIVSLRPCHERLLPEGSGEVLVALSMTGETFATWIIACYLQAEDQPEEIREAAARRRRNEIPYDEKRYLRVTYEVLTRWPSEPLDCCETRELQALQGIRDAILELPLLRPEVTPPAPEETLPPVPEITAPPAPAVEEEPPTTVEPVEEAEPDPVLEALRELGDWVPRPQLVAKTGLSKNRVNERLKELESAGQVERRSEKGKPNLYHAVAGEE
ncbi:MAG: hypothetical protein ACJ76N_01645 [Thermoanaerobaculia bacterium]